uniref:Peroxiredoxin-like 2A n=1 Tax=Anthurium amnicola TaxID=1678845 RepID=A0A1D1Y8W1_9ARAE
MASFSMEEFMGEGALKGIVPKLVDEGWDDVPTLKMMNSWDMELLGMTLRQKDALEIRSYLHDRSLMQYADVLEASRQSLSELLNLSTSVLSSQFSMKRGHVARFVDRTGPFGVSMPSYVLPARQRSASSVRKSMDKDELSSTDNKNMHNVESSMAPSLKHEVSIEQSITAFKIKEGHVFKGIVASEPSEPRVCGCVQPPPVVDEVAPYTSVESISIQKLTPEYKVGMERLVKTKAPPMKASDLWHDKPVVLLCLRRPGCLMCRAEAHQLYARKPIFDALGFQMIAVLHEHIESEVKDFWPRYWGGVVIHDRNMGFFRALGGGKLLKDNIITGFFFNNRSIANYKRAKATVPDGNYKGVGDIKGGLFIIGSSKGGIAYQFMERNFGDWAPISEVIEICSRLKNELPNERESLETV